MCVLKQNVYTYFALWDQKVSCPQNKGLHVFMCICFFMHVAAPKACVSGFMPSLPPHHCYAMPLGVFADLILPSHSSSNNLLCYLWEFIFAGVADEMSARKNFINFGTPSNRLTCKTPKLKKYYASYVNVYFVHKIYAVLLNPWKTLTRYIVIG